MPPGDVLLDTNALSAIAENSPSAINRAGAFTRLVLPLPVYAEARYGILRAKSLRGKIGRVSALLQEYPLLGMDRGTGDQFARLYAELSTAGRRIPSNDIWIAAIALQQNLPLMTRDAHFDRIPELTKIEW